MPHATDEMSNMTNGEMGGSKTVSQIKSYPLVHEAIETFKSNPLGGKAIEIADGAFNRFGKPMQPYLETPLSFAKPYASKADELAASGLQKIDNTFPIMKEDPSTIMETAKGYVFWPFNYVTSTYNDEYSKTASNKNRGQGFNTMILAIISTQLKITSDGFQTVANFLGPKYDDSKKKGSEYVRSAEDAAGKYKAIGQEKFEQYSKLGQEKGDQLKKDAEGTADQAKAKGQDAKEQTKGAAQQTKEDAKAKSGSK